MPGWNIGLGNFNVAALLCAFVTVQGCQPFKSGADRMGSGGQTNETDSTRGSGGVDIFRTVTKAIGGWSDAGGTTGSVGAVITWVAGTATGGFVAVSVGGVNP